MRKAAARQIDQSLAAGGQGAANGMQCGLGDPVWVGKALGIDNFHLRHLSASRALCKLQVPVAPCRGVSIAFR